MANIVPYFGYRDARAALAWLSNAFGLEKVIEVLGPDGKVQHAEMRFGDGFIMLGQDDERSETTPSGPGVYLVIQDVDSHFERARATGAEIVYPPEDTEFGTRRYRTRDIEGYEWSFGTYSPGFSWDQDA